MRKLNICLSLFSMLFVGVVSSTNGLTNSSIQTNAIQYYKIGTRLEAEDHTYTNCTPITNNMNASNGVCLDAGDGGYVTFTFNIELAGRYDLAIGYYTGTSGAAIGVKANDGAFSSYQTLFNNGWCNNTSYYPIEHLVSVELISGENTLVISSDNIGQNKYLNIDYIKLVENFKADGSRIQAEKASSFKCENGYIRNYVVPNVCDDKVASIDDNVLAKPIYKINVPETGEYVFQIAYYSQADVTYKFNFEQTSTTSINVNLPSCPGGFPNVANNYLPYTSKAAIKINLTAGDLYLSFQYISQGFADFDWFRLYPVEDNTLTYLEAEDYVFGDANVQKETTNYPVLSNYAVELAQGNITFNVSVNETNKYRLYIGAYTATNNAYLNLKLNGNDIKLQVNDKFATGWTNDVIKRNVMHFDISLYAGVNTFIFTKGGDEINANYIDIDYFKISKNNILVPSIELDFSTNTSVVIDNNILDYENTYTLEVSNTNVARLVDNTLYPVKGGSTTLFIKYEVNNAEVVDELLINVNVTTYHDLSAFKAYDTTKTYNGELQYVDVSMPEGWSFTQIGANPNVGTYVVKVIFSHPNYEDVVIYPVILTITKANYLGDDLYCDDATFIYDGEEHTLSASAPLGWTISYSENSFKEIGEYKVTITFSHTSYNDVVKECVVKVIPKPQETTSNNPLFIVLGVVGGVVLFVGLTVAGYIFIKKYRANHEVIK